MLNRGAELSLLKQSMAETITSKKIVGTHCRCFLIVNDRIVDSFLLKQSISQSHLRVRIIRFLRDCLLAIEDGLIYFAFP